MQDLPRWKTDNIYSALDGADYLAAVAELESRLTTLETWSENRLTPEAPAEDLAAAIDQQNGVTLLASTLDSFVYAFLSTDSYNDVATRETSRLELLAARRQKIFVRLQMWIGSLAARLPALIAHYAPLQPYAYHLQEQARQAKYLMSAEMESLAADLVIDGGLAFGKLQGTVTSQLKVPFENEAGEIVPTPIGVIRNHSQSPDRALRERAYHAELASWKSIESTVAACLNGVKGTAATLAKRRGRSSVLEAALDDNQIDPATHAALMSALEEALPLFRKYLQAKATKLGLDRLAWWDLFAPIDESEERFTWPRACEFITEQFASFDADMAGFAETNFRENWIDAPVRDGKRGGAFCMEVIGVEESRILLNYDGSFDSVTTLAHELGHGYHNHCQRGLEPLRRGTPMTLAETASIFCETIVAEAALAVAKPRAAASILEAQLCGATQVCLDIYSRFLFETAVFARREQGELTADEFSSLMSEAQAATYADAVDPSTYHPYMWLWKPHYYAHTSNFYNFPYAFGHLFSLGLYQRFRDEGAAFVPRYQKLLRSTALVDARTLAAEFGIDLADAAFWRGSMAVVAAKVERFAQTE